MESLWRAAIGLTGISGVGAFVFYGLYKGWMTLPAVATLTRDQRFRLFRLFLVLVFIFGVATLGLSAFISHDGAQATQRSASELRDILKNKQEVGDKLIKEYQAKQSPEAAARLEEFHKNYLKENANAMDALNQGQINRYHDSMKKLIISVNEQKDITPEQKDKFIRDVCQMQPLQPTTPFTGQGRQSVSIENVS